MVHAPPMFDFHVARADLRSVKVIEVPPAEIEPGQVRLRVDRFALTANNITYAVLGDAFSYWKFFPAADGWGRIPVWGFAEVVETRHEAVALAQRFFGFLPMSTHTVVSPQHAGASGFTDGAAHRAELPGIYNRYALCAPGSSAQSEAEESVFRPLVATAFLLADSLVDQSFFGAKTVWLSSASSKTAIACAHALASTRATTPIVGLTSLKRVEFVRGLGCYDRVAAYEDVGALPNDGPVVYVDLAGAGALRRAIHVGLGERLVASLIVGATHAPSDGRADAMALPGPRPTLFFAPAHIEKRSKDWGPAGLRERMSASSKELLAAMSGSIRIVERRGPEAIEQTYRSVLDGSSPSDEAYVLSW